MNKEIVMVHGWDTRNYNSHLNCERLSEGVAWDQRRELIELLQKNYSLRFFNLPGFCGVKEPEKEFFDVSDFSDNFAKWLKGQKIKPTAIVGYSFGGVVALDFKVRYKSDIPVVLISPALKRQETIKSQVGKIGKSLVPEKYSDALKSLYQTLFSRYYREGTLFLRASYDRIARRDIRPMLERVDPKDSLLIYGDSDTATPANYITELVNKKGLKCFLVKGGNHNIGEIHPKEITKVIMDFLSR